MSDLQKQNAQSDNTNIALGPLEDEVALNCRYEACQDTIAQFVNKIKIVYTTLGVSTPGDEKPGTANTGSATTDTATCTTAGAAVSAGAHTPTLIPGTVTTVVSQAASPTANDAAAAVAAAHDGAGIGQAVESKSTVKVETNSDEKNTKQNVKRILDKNIQVAILQR
jgi:hypothetical protein